MEGQQRIPMATCLWLQSILFHGQEAFRITENQKYLDDTHHAVELIMRVVGEFEGVPQHLQQQYVNFWCVARAYGKSLRVGWLEDAEALKMTMMDDETHPIPRTIKAEALYIVENLVHVDYHTFVTALKLYQYLDIRMKGKEPMEKVIPPRPRESPQAPISESNALLVWYQDRLDVT